MPLLTAMPDLAREVVTSTWIMSDVLEQRLGWEIVQPTLLDLTTVPTGKMLVLAVKVRALQI